MGYGQDKGIIPRICDCLFYFIERTGDAKNFKVDASYLEVLLLSPDPRLACLPSICPASSILMLCDLCFLLP